MKLSLIILFALGLLLSGCTHGGHHQKMWETMDADADGTVSKAEFDQAHSEQWLAMDSDKDGKVTKEEKIAFHKSQKKCGCKKPKP